MNISLVPPPAPGVPAYAEINIAGEQAGSPLFNDVYFSDAGGYLESEHVFIQGNGLPERLACREEDAKSAPGSASGGDRLREFVIGETGFGTGRNLLTLLKLLHDLRNQGIRLPEIHYITVEKHPLLPRDLEKAQSIFKNLARESLLFRSCYRAPVSGLQTLCPEPGVTVHLLVGDIREICPAIRLSRPVDAWFLDGFSPALNPEMWSLSVFRELRRLSAPGTTLATYTVSGAVRRNLNEAGFVTAKLPGYGRKREMTAGWIP